MKFIEAQEKMAQIANGRYHSIEFKRIVFSDGEVETNCSLYLDPKIRVDNPTWEMAFAALDKAIYPMRAPIEESPEI